ncbi:MAG: DUF367 family protein [Halobacteriaceae archaeon]
MDLHVRYAGEDDPEKCTARRLADAGEVTLHRSDRQTPPGLVLDPLADRALSPADDPDRLVAVDCSWDQGDATRFDLDGPRRALPFLVAGNAVNFGRPFQLTTAEALGGALAILGRRDRAESLLAPFAWGDTFLELNAEPLRRYANCEDSAAVVDVQADYLADEDDQPAARADGDSESDG